jgi:hypothetical protein
MVVNSILLLFIFLLITATFLALNPKATESILRYLDIQVMGSMQGKRGTSSRLSMLYDLFQQLVIIIILCSAIILSNLKKFTTDFKKNSEIVSPLILFLLIGLSASIPLMISPRLSAYYLVPALPFFAIFFAMLISENVYSNFAGINQHLFWVRFISYFSYALIGTIIIYSILNFGNACRDNLLINDVNAIGKIVPSKSIISLAESQSENWNLMGYLQRKFQISVDLSGKQNEYLLVEKNVSTVAGYKNTGVKLTGFILFRHIP